MYIKLDNNNNVLRFYAFEFDDATLSLELSDDEIDEIFGKSFYNYKVINNKFVYQYDRAILQEKNANTSRFRAWRERFLQKYDLLRQCALNQDIDPKTNLPYPAITEGEKQWRLAVLNFTDQITHETTEADYPQPPERLK